MKIKSVCIVGGGSSGWMTAAALSVTLPHLKVSLIESPNIKTIGVGESTLGHINGFLEILNMKDEDWMKECDATYKVSIQFDDFYKKGTSYQYPFGDMDMDALEWHLMSAISPETFPPETYSRYVNPTTYLAEFNKITENVSGLVAGFDFKYHTAYHMDAEKFGAWLKNNKCQNVSCYYDTITSCEYKEDGSISKLIGERGEYESDLYIDCTGFKSLLLEKFMGNEFISYNDHLLNDSAIAARIPYKDKEIQMKNTTACTAIENGWVWNIPLWSRMGTGYAYSSKFVDDETAKKEFVNHLVAKGFVDEGEEVETFKINIRHGKRKKCWDRNVVGVGLAYGFLEPLESTGLLTTHENIMYIIDILQKTDCDPRSFDLSALNRSADYDIDGWMEFIFLHYSASAREDTEYWRYVTNLDLYDHDKLVAKEVLSPRQYIECIHAYARRETTQGLAGNAYVMAGSKKSVYSKSSAQQHVNKYNVDLQVYHENYLKKDKRLRNTVASMQSHYEFLRDTIYAE